MNNIDWYVGLDDEFEVLELLDVDGDYQSPNPQYLVEVWASRLGFEELRTFDEEEPALAFAKRQARKTGGRYRVLKAPEGKSFDRIRA